MAVSRHGNEVAALLAAGTGIIAGTLLFLRKRTKKVDNPVGRGSAEVVILGVGYCGGAIGRDFSRRGCAVLGTTRGQADPADTRAGVRTLVMDGAQAMKDLAAAVQGARLIIATAPPGEAGDPFLADADLQAAIVAAVAQGVVLIYLSSVGVYGDQSGSLVTEETPPAPRTARAKRRLAAEEAWRRLLPETGASGHLIIVRLPGIYGAFRGPLAKAREGNTRIAKEGHVFSRIHVEDVISCCKVLAEKLRSGSDSCMWLFESGPAAVINCCDSDPAPQHEVSGLAYEVLGLPVPPAIPFETAELSAMQRSFYEESRLMGNEKLIKLVGSLQHPSYRTGIPASLVEERACAALSAQSQVVSKFLRSSFDRSKAALSSLASLNLLRGRTSILRVALVDNGSLKPEATLSLRSLAAALQEQSDKEGRCWKVEAVAARFADRIPARDIGGKAAEILPGWLKRVAEEGVNQKVLLLPLLIGPSNTLTKTFPQAARAVPALEVMVAPTLVCTCPVIYSPEDFGADAVAEILKARLAELEKEPPGSTREHRIFLCDHGSPVARVAAAREAVRIELEQRLGLGKVLGVCMERRDGPDFDFNGPLLEEALMALPHGCTVHVALLFLQAGRHAGPGGDIVGIVAGVMEKRPDLSVQTTRVMAGHPGLNELLMRRAEKRIPVELLP